jgi:hypothetical protein
MDNSDNNKRNDVVTRKVYDDDNTMREEEEEGRIKSVHFATQGSNAERAARVCCPSAIPIHGIHRTFLFSGFIVESKETRFFIKLVDNNTSTKPHSHATRQQRDYQSKAKEENTRLSQSCSLLPRPSSRHTTTTSSRLWPRRQEEQCTLDDQ